MYKKKFNLSITNESVLFMCIFVTEEYSSSCHERGGGDLQ